LGGGRKGIKVIKMIKIAVVGGGIFGVTAAVKLAQKGYSVDLFEKEKDILQAASGINQYRLHRGYHYPRSRETVVSLLKSNPFFHKEYAEAIIGDADHYYCIAKKGSLISAADYLQFCREHKLEYREVSDFALINKNSVDLCLKVKEELLDPNKLRELCQKRLRENGIRVILGTMANEEKLRPYDFVVIAAYADQNRLVKDAHVDYQYELCEKPVVRLPKIFHKKSIVIMDGPFMCVDPVGETGLFVIGNVVHAIHHVSIGKHPAIPEKFRPFLNQGVIKNPPITNFEKFIASGSEFIPELKKAEPVGSMFTIRAVLPYQDATDARPTIVSSIDHRTITVFSGKIANCVAAANEIIGIMEQRLS
jgi:hypothetical protein